MEDIFQKELDYNWDDSKDTTLVYWADDRPGKEYHSIEKEAWDEGKADHMSIPITKEEHEEYMIKWVAFKKQNVEKKKQAVKDSFPRQPDGSLRDYSTFVAGELPVSNMAFTKYYIEKYEEELVLFDMGEIDAMDMTEGQYKDLLLKRREWMHAMEDMSDEEHAH